METPIGTIEKYPVSVDGCVNSVTPPFMFCTIVTNENVKKNEHIALKPATFTYNGISWKFNRVLARNIAQSWICRVVFMTANTSFHLYIYIYIARNQIADVIRLTTSTIFSLPSASFLEEIQAVRRCNFKFVECILVNTHIFNSFKRLVLILTLLERFQCCKHFRTHSEIYITEHSLYRYWIIQFN